MGKRVVVSRLISSFVFASPSGTRSYAMPRKSSPSSQLTDIQRQALDLLGEGRRADSARRVSYKITVH